MKNILKRLKRKTVITTINIKIVKKISQKNGNISIVNLIMGMLNKKNKMRLLNSANQKTQR